MMEIGLDGTGAFENEKTTLQGLERRSVKMVAGTRFELMTFRL